jgi:hypothetical protein
MLIPIFEAYGIIDSYPLSDALEAAATLALQNSVNLDLNLPYGQQATGFAAGFICQLANQAGSTVLVLSTGTAPFGIFADSFTDSLKSGRASFYYLCDNNKFQVQSNYDTSQTYAVNTLLTVVGTGTNLGRLTPAANYSAQPTVGIVMEAPSNAANDDSMVIQTDLQY